MIAALLALVAVTRRERVPTPAATGVKSVAILPLNVIGGTAEESHLGVGIADAIITRLAAVRRIALRPTTAVLPYAAQSPDVAAVWRRPGRRSGHRRNDPADGNHLSCQPADGSRGRSRRELGAYARYVTRRSAGAPGPGRRADCRRPEPAIVRVTNAPASVVDTRTTPPRTRVYLKGRSLLVNYTETNMREAVASFEQALAIDTDYALARSALATACAWFSVRYAYGTGSDRVGTACGARGARRPGE